MSSPTGPTFPSESAAPEPAPAPSQPRTARGLPAITPPRPATTR